jgi:hypothetical protein
VDLSLGTGDPIVPADPRRQDDSQLEERFARAFRKLAPDWDVFREPEPIDASRRWLREIVGFVCPRCAGPRRIVGAVTEPHLLGALGLASQPPPHRSVTAS